MKAWITIGLILIVISGATSFTGKTQKKDYQKGYEAGYDKGYNDAILKYIEKDALRQQQFQNTMKQMGDIITKYNKATAHIKSL